MKIGDKVTFDTDKLNEFKKETNVADSNIQEYRNLVIAGVNEIGEVKVVGTTMSTVEFTDGWVLDIPNKYLLLLPCSSE